MLTPDTVLQNRYRILRQLGQGGMGTVYEAKALRLNTMVAIKEAHFTEDRMRRQFEREAQLLAGLRHPALPRVIDHFDEGDGLFLVMDYISGEDLWEQLVKKDSAFPLNDVLTWADQLLDALNYLHNQSPPIIHRDIKPQNLKVNEAGHIILLDFGLAKGFMGQVSRATTSSSIFGYTPSYAPLEQMQGEGTDAGSDLYSLAATIYNLMTNVVPADVLKRVVALTSGEPEPLLPAHQINPQIPQSVSEVLAHALAIARNKRFESAAQMREALRQASRNVAFNTVSGIDQIDTSTAKTIVSETAITPLATIASPSESSPNQKTHFEPVAEETNQKQSAIPTVVLPAAPVTETSSSGQRKWLLPVAAGAVFLVIFASIVGLVYLKFGGISIPNITGNTSSFLSRLTKEDMQFLLKDANPAVLKQMSEDPEFKRKQVDSIKEFLAIANQAHNEGLDNDPDVKKELEDIRTQVVAQTYDKEKNKDKGQLPPFSLISEDQIKAYYAKSGNQTAFDEYLKRKIGEAKKEGVMPQDRQPSEEEIKGAKDFYAKMRISEAEAKEKAKDLGEEYNRHVELQVKLQQAQYLNKIYADKVLKEKIKVTDDELNQYVVAHPELDPKAKKAKAEEILQRIKSGEDFAKIADELTEDPGSKGKGGLYKDVEKGQMTPEFEQSALALEPGKITDKVVESRYGYHIVKLEKKGTKKKNDGTDTDVYDARHILISTMYTDPKNPGAPPIPLIDKVKADLQEAKSSKILEEIKAKNPVEIEDFEVPKPSDADVQKMTLPQMPMTSKETPESKKR